jgi:hypothetical protein
MVRVIPPEIDYVMRRMAWLGSLFIYRNLDLGTAMAILERPEFLESVDHYHGGSLAKKSPKVLSAEIAGHPASRRQAGSNVLQLA